MKSGSLQNYYRDKIGDDDDDDDDDDDTSEGKSFKYNTKIIGNKEL